MLVAVSRLGAAAISVALLVAGCGDDKPALSEQLEHYTDAGDGCQQVVSAITYADAQLKPIGQERYQDFDDAVRSSIATVSGTVALEVRDFPSEQVLLQARRVAELARLTAAKEARGDRRVRLLREYRREALQFVLVCAREVPDL